MELHGHEHRSWWQHDTAERYSISWAGSDSPSQQFISVPFCILPGWYNTQQLQTFSRKILPLLFALLAYFDTLKFESIKQAFKTSKVGSEQRRCRCASVLLIFGQNTGRYGPKWGPYGSCTHSRIFTNRFTKTAAVSFDQMVTSSAQQ